MSLLLSLGIGGFLVSAVIVGAMIRYSRRAGIMDVPNHRSSHSVPTPRGGGLGLVAAVVASLTFEITRRYADYASFLLLVVLAAAILAVTGWMDDRGKSSIGARIAVHAAAGIAIAALVNRIAPGQGWLNVAWLAWWAFWTVASINIVNFMDGIDGLVATQGIIYGVYAAFLAGPDTFGFGYGIVLASACAGFTVWNWAPARIFMGDAGAGPLGLFLVLGGALALRRSSAALIFLPLLPLYLDALLTMLMRARKGERLIDAHRSHLYQRIANAGVGHAAVTTGYALAALVGAGIGILLQGAPPLNVLAAISGYVILAFITWLRLDAAFPQETFASGGLHPAP